MNVALDTNAYSDFMRGIPSRVDIVQTASRLFLPIIVLGELRAGFAAGSREPENLQVLQAFLSSSRVTILPASDETTKQYGRIFLSLRKKGITIPTNDLWIAALALEHDLELCTSDAHFKDVDGLRVC